MKLVIKLSIFFISVLFPFTNALANAKETVEFKKCIDGDTAVFEKNHQEIKVRFLAIDTPETVHPSKKAEAYGKNASEYTCNRIKEAKKIELEYDSGSTKLDKYNRVLAWIWVDNSLLQKELIEVGYAEVKYIYGNYIYTNELYELEKIAKDEKIGIWSDYVPKTYQIIFDEGENEKVLTLREYEKLEYYIPTKEGYEFISWQVGGKDFDFATVITEDTTLLATYEKTDTFLDYALIMASLLIIVLTSKKSFKKKLKKFF